MKYMNLDDFWEKMQHENPVHIIFICAGNICRSPFAEMKFEQLLNHSKVKNKTKFKIQSGGFLNQKIPIHPLTKQSLLDDNIKESRINNFHSRTMRKHKEDLQNATVLIVMSKSNRDIQTPAKYREKTILLSTIAEDLETDIPDPALIEDYIEYKKIMDSITSYLERFMVKLEQLGV